MGATASRTGADAKILPATVEVGFFFLRLGRAAAGYASLVAPHGAALTSITPPARACFSVRRHGALAIRASKAALDSAALTQRILPRLPRWR